MPETEEEHQALAESLASLRAAMSPEAVRRADIAARINQVYIETERDELLSDGLDELIENAAAATGSAEKRRALFLVGESGSGKSTALRWHLSRRPEFQPRTLHDGETVYPLVSFDAPKPLKLKLLAKTGLNAIGYPFFGNSTTEYDMWDLFKQQLKERRVLFLHIDEMQHVIRGNKPDVIMDIADVLKSLVQIPGWPLHVIFSGVPALAKFLDQEKQLKERSIVLRFDQLRPTEDTDLVREIVAGIVEGDAGMKGSGIYETESIHRLVHAVEGGFGTSIALIRAAIKSAMRLGDDVVTVEHFSHTYARATGCRPEQNIFTAKDWKTIIPSNSLKDLTERHDRQILVSSGRKTPR